MKTAQLRARGDRRKPRLEGRAMAARITSSNRISAPARYRRGETCGVDDRATHRATLHRQQPLLRLRAVAENALPLVLSIVFAVGVHGAELLTVAQARTDSQKCGCAADCACRGADQGCSCSKPALSITARCGCGGSEPRHEISTPSWDIVFSEGCRVAGPLLALRAAPGSGVPRAWRLAHEHEHPPRSRF